MKKQEGITLIALVITIIVLLILAGVTIAMLTGENGLLSRAKSTVPEQAVAGAKDEVALIYQDAFAGYLTSKYTGDGSDTLAELFEDGIGDMSSSEKHGCDVEFDSTESTVTISYPAGAAAADVVLKYEATLTTTAGSESLGAWEKQ